jgi:hypothetical protein
VARHRHAHLLAPVRVEELADLRNHGLRQARGARARAGLVQVPEPAFHLRFVGPAVVVVSGGDEARADVLGPLEHGAGAAERDDDVAAPHAAHLGRAVAHCHVPDEAGALPGPRRRG